MIAKTEAIVLRLAPFSRTSQVVTWLTRDYGRVSTVVKGALRPKSAFLGQYDLFYTCELLFYERARGDLHVTRECTPLQPRSVLRGRWPHYTCAAYVCDLVLHSTLPNRHAQDETYELLTAALDALCRLSQDPLVLLHWFEWRWLQVLGYAPHLQGCLHCGSSLGRQAGFDAMQGGALCGMCLPRPVPDHVVPLGPDMQSLLRQWSGSSTLGWLKNIVLSGKQLLALQDIAGRMLAYCLETRPDSRDVAIATLRCQGGKCS